MARFSRPPFDQESIALQLEPFLGRPAIGEDIRTFGASLPARLAEAIPMWRLDENKLPGAHRVSDAATYMGRWHHQIVSGAGPIAHAVSTDDGAATLTTVDHGDALARAIDEAIERLDGQEISDSVEVRLLALPSFHLSTLWLTDSSVDVVYLLHSTTFSSAEARLDLAGVDVVQGSEFLDLLRKAGPIRGFVSSREI